MRSSDPGFATCHGGGFVASGVGNDRHPVVHWPSGVTPTGMEGWGEVQTPLKDPKGRLSVGDVVLCRHAKAGELMERVSEVVLVEAGEIVERVPTYRGLGW